MMMMMMIEIIFSFLIYLNELIKSNQVYNDDD